MNYEQASELIGKRIEIPVHYDKWMQGAKYGRVIALKNSFGGGEYLLVEMDNIKAGYVKIWRSNWDYIRTL